jgi:hypothetical protein
MIKKKKTLPKNFKELIEYKDIENLKKVFDTCELDARGGYGKSTALSFYNIPNELVRWLVASGADIDAVDNYKRTALHSHAMTHNGYLTIFLELGANINAKDYDGNTALHFASGSGFNVTGVKKLIEYGAKINALNNANQTPLEYALQRANNIDIVDLVAISDIFLKINNKITQRMKDAIICRGEDFEFHREDFNKDYLKETDEALTKLYEMYNVAPIKKRIVHDGVNPIHASGTTWQQQYEELWDLLVPSSGSAKTVQGEVVRISGKVRDEIYRNGGVNWDANFRKMLDAFIHYLSSGISLQSDELKKADLIIKNIRRNGNGEIDDLNFLSELATKWVLINPNPILQDKANYKR